MTCHKCSGTNVVENNANGKSFQFCRDCRIEVIPRVDIWQDNAFVGMDGYVGLQEFLDAVVSASPLANDSKDKR